jgi:aminomethyltransferase
MPLYGHEISEEINPLVAGLGFAVKHDKEFIGSSSLNELQNKGLTKKIVAIEMLERGIPRNGYEVYFGDVKVGVITTGYMIPNTNKSYAFVLMDTEFSKIGTEVMVLIRKSYVSAKVRNKKFLEKKYIR